MYTESWEHHYYTLTTPDATVPVIGSRLLPVAMTPLPHTCVVYLVLLEVSAYSPPLIIGQCVSVLLEQCIDARDTTVPRVL